MIEHHRDEIEVEFDRDYYGAQQATLKTRGYPTRFLHDRRIVKRRYRPRGFLELILGRATEAETLRDWLMRVEQTRLQMIAEWNAIERAELGEDMPDPVIRPEDVPEPAWTSDELEALRAIGEQPG